MAVMFGLQLEAVPATAQEAGGQPDEIEATLREKVSRLNQLTDQAPNNLTVGHELVSTYRKLAEHYQKIGMHNLAEQANDRVQAIRFSISRAWRFCRRCASTR